MALFNIMIAMVSISERTELIAMSGFGFWIAVAAVIAGVGKFLDDYYIGNPSREWLRGQLIKGFIFLESPLLPRLFGPRTAWMNWYSLAIMACFLYFSTLPPTVFGSMIPFLKSPQLAFLLSAASLSAFWVRNLLLFGNLSHWRIGDDTPPLRDVLRTTGRAIEALPKKRVRLARIANLCLAALYSIIFVTMFRNEIMTFTDIVIVIISSLVFTMITYIIVNLLILRVVILLLFLLNVIINIIQKIIQHVFDKASSPKNSPFTYLGALTGLAVLMAKIIQEVAK